MNLSQFKKVKEEMGADNVNKLLAEGWELISIAQTTDGTGTHFLYCLGWREPVGRLGP